MSTAGETVFLHAAEGTVELVPLPNSRFKVTLQPHAKDAYTPRNPCETSLPLDVIQAFLDVSFNYLCDALSRHDEPEYVRFVLHRQFHAYVGEADLLGTRVLDFGCGTGASTFCLGEILPDAEVVGAELDAQRLGLAKRVLAALGRPNVHFFVSPDPSNLPPAIGAFDFVVLSAVYEHLLPAERRELLPLI